MSSALRPAFDACFGVLARLQWIDKVAVMGPIRRESWQEYRRRMLEETSRFIEWGLRHPEEVIEIPAKPVEQGGFPREVAQWFWLTVLELGDGRLAARWRQRLRAVGRFVWRR